MGADLKSRFAEQVAVEIKNAEGLESAVAGLKNILVRELLGSIAYDSRKHASMFKALIQHLTAPSTAMTEQEFESLKRTVEEHIRLELSMIRFLEEALRGELDSRVRYILLYILEDERRHHSLLSGLLEAIVSREVLTEEQWWDLVWRDTIFRGTPGG